MNLEQQFRNGLAGQLSSDKTDVDIRVAVKIAREFAGKFVKWYDNLDEKFYSTKDWDYNDILKYFEDEVYSK